MKFTEVKRGYDPLEVEEYIKTLDGVIKSYKEKDNAIKNAIISAQMAADNMIKNAKLQADEYKVQLVRELEHVRTAVERERSKIQDFQDTYASLIRKYLMVLDEKDMSEIHSKLDGVDELIDHLCESEIAPITGIPPSRLGAEFSLPGINFAEQVGLMDEETDNPAHNHEKE